MATIEPKWKCDICERVFNRYSDAEDCWRNCVVDSVADVSEVYVCPICKDEHDHEADAITCCGYDPDSPPPPPTAEELEAAGQARLPI
jgi:hypothetical protein